MKTCLKKSVNGQSRISNLEFKGYVPYQEVNAYYARSRIFVNTSDSEGFPNSFLQSWVRGTPVFSFFDPDGIIVREGLGSSPVDTEQMALEIKQLIQDHGRLAALSAHVHQYALDHYSPNAVALRYHELIQDLFRTGSAVMINVLFIVTSLRRAGAETQVVDMVNALRDPELQCQLLCFEADLSQRDRVSDTVKFHHVPRRSKYDLSFISGIARIIDQEEIDVVYATMEFSILVGWLSIRRARRKPRLIGAIHTTLIRNIKEQLHDRLIYQWIFRQCDSIVFVCQKQADFWVARYPFLAKNSTVIHNGIDLSRFSDSFRDEKTGDSPGRLDVPANAYIISCIAGFRPEKRHDLLLAAFGRLEATAHLYLAGDGVQRSSIVSLVDQMGFAGTCAFSGEH